MREIVTWPLAVAALAAAFFVPVGYWDIALPKDNGHQLNDKDWQLDDVGRFQVRLDGKWFEVPSHAVLSAPGQAGHAVVWIGDGKIQRFIPAH